jgi:hypothetical protein
MSSVNVAMNTILVRTLNTATSVLTLDARTSVGGSEEKIMGEKKREIISWGRKSIILLEVLRKCPLMLLMRTE